MRRPIRKPEILIIEDNNWDYHILERAFKTAKVNAILTRYINGQEALDALFLVKEDRALSLIILDLRLAKVSSLEVLKQLKEHPFLHLIPVLMLADTYSLDEVIASYQLGANSFIPKPRTYAQLIDIIQILSIYWLDTCQLA